MSSINSLNALIISSSEPQALDFQLEINLNKLLIKFNDMTFKQIMGFIYLFVFIGAMIYKFNYFITGLQDTIPIVLLVLIILSILLLAIRKILLEE